jgi:hypothetical protein
MVYIKFQHLFLASQDTKKMCLDELYIYIIDLPTPPQKPSVNLVAKKQSFIVTAALYSGIHKGIGLASRHVRFLHRGLQPLLQADKAISCPVHLNDECKIYCGIGRK